MKMNGKQFDINVWDSACISVILEKHANKNYDVKIVEEYNSDCYLNVKIEGDKAMVDHRISHLEIQFIDGLDLEETVFTANVDID